MGTKQAGRLRFPCFFVNSFIISIRLLKTQRTILRLARKGLSQFWLVIFKPNRYGSEDRQVPAGEYGSGD